MISHWASKLSISPLSLALISRNQRSDCEKAVFQLSFWLCGNLSLKSMENRSGMGTVGHKLSTCLKTCIALSPDLILNSCSVWGPSSSPVMASLHPIREISIKSSPNLAVSSLWVFLGAGHWILHLSPKLDTRYFQQLNVPYRCTKNVIWEDNTVLKEISSYVEMLLYSINMHFQHLSSQHILTGDFPLFTKRI